MARDTSGAVTWRTLLNETIEVLGERPQARWICETACGLDGDEFLAELDEPATERMVAQLDAMVARYRAGEPLAYVMGHWSFRTIELMVDRRVLIPRPETEMVAGRALELARGVAGQRRVVDLGTGSGAIGLSLSMWHEPMQSVLVAPPPMFGCVTVRGLMRCQLMCVARLTWL